ncbi:MAG: cobyric acid synthase, partial [Pseudomonadota bacterium]
PQNMSNNAAACLDGGEIGRAQALQALACGIDANTDHNPVLLKPETDRVAQVVVHGKALSSMDAAHYMSSRQSLLEPVMQSFSRLLANNDLVIVEGAGSPAEVNLRDRDIANMGFARRADVPVCLLGDIERGGVIASLVGTRDILDPDDAAMITGFIVNKFRGDPALFTDGVSFIESRTTWPCHGVIPWIPAMSRLPAEDAVSMGNSETDGSPSLRVFAPMLSRMANFDDADPLRLEPSVDFSFIPPGTPLPRDADLVILFGTKSTIGDLGFLRRQGWDHDIIAHARHGGRVLGICGGYQMLGQSIDDPLGVDGEPGRVDGLGLLNIHTAMTAEKTVRPVSGHCANTGARAEGYEIHVGRTQGGDCQRPLMKVDDRDEGAASPDGRIRGTYIHGLLNHDAYRDAFLRELGAAPSAIAYSDTVSRSLDEIADAVAASVDIDAMFATARRPAVH